MSKAPAFQFYPNDYARDTRVLTPAARGIWMDVLCVLFWTGPFVRSKTLSVSDWSRLVSVTQDEFSSAFSEFQKHNICDSSQDSHGNVTLTSRRMLSDDKERRDAAKRKQKERDTKSKSQVGHKNVTELSRRSSSSSSSSVTKVTLSGETSEGDEVHQILKTSEVLGSMSYEQDLEARRLAGRKLKDPELIEVARLAVRRALVMGELDHPAAWWQKQMEPDDRAGSSRGFGQKKESPAPRICDSSAPEVL